MIKKQLSSIVLECVARIKVLNYFGIDYTTNRDKSIEEIADEKKINLFALVQDLSDANNYKQLKKSDFKDWTQNQIIDEILLKQHEKVKELSSYFINKSNALNRTHGKECPLLLELKGLIRNMMEDIIAHVQREENTLFPAIKHIENKGNDSMLAESALFSSIITLIQNHEHANDDTSLIENLANQILANPSINTEIIGFCNEVLGLCAALNQHIFIEDEILFKMVEEM